MRYHTFIFSLSCKITSVTSYLSENKAEDLRNGDDHLRTMATNHLATPTKWRQTIWRIEVSEGSFLCIFHARGEEPLVESSSLLDHLQHLLVILSISQNIGCVQYSRRTILRVLLLYGTKSIFCRIDAITVLSYG